MGLSVLAETQESSFYIVSKNDTLSSIAIKTGVPHTALYGPGGRLDQLIQMNPQIKDPDRIQPGEKIQITLKNALASFTKPVENVRDVH